MFTLKSCSFPSKVTRLRLACSQNNIQVQITSLNYVSTAKTTIDHTDCFNPLCRNFYKES